MRIGTAVRRLWRGNGGPVEEHDPVRQKAASRLDHLPTVDVLNWADQVGTGVAKALDDYRRQGTPESLLEARHGTQSLLGVIDVLDCRQA